MQVAVETQQVTSPRVMSCSAVVYDSIIEFAEKHDMCEHLLVDVVDAWNQARSHYNWFSGGSLCEPFLNHGKFSCYIIDTSGNNQMNKHKHIAPFASSLTMVLAISAAAVVTLSGCAPGKNDIAPWVAPDYVQHPVLGRIDKAEVALVGPDANENGIRDQLDTYIASQIAHSAQPAAKAYSLALTRAIIEGKRGAASPSANLAVGVAAQCLVASSNTQTVESLGKLIVNTAPRIDAMARFRAANSAPATSPACA